MLIKLFLLVNVTDLQFIVKLFWPEQTNKILAYDTLRRGVLSLIIFHCSKGMGWQ